MTTTDANLDPALVDLVAKAIYDGVQANGGCTIPWGRLESWSPEFGHGRMATEQWRQYARYAISALTNATTGADCT